MPATAEQPLVDYKDPTIARKAYEELKGLIEGVDEGRLLAVSVSVPRLIPVVLQSVERVKKLEARMRALPELDFDLVQDVTRRAFALLRAEELLTQGSDAQEQLAELIERGLTLREELLQWAPTLVAWKVFSQPELDGWIAGKGHVDTATDLVQAGEAYLARWSSIEGKVDLTRERAESAVQLGEKLLQAIGARLSRDEAKALIRNRRAAFTLLSEAWEELRRALTYLRWHEGDVDEIAPSLYAAGRRPKEGGKPEQDEKPAEQ